MTSPSSRALAALLPLSLFLVACQPSNDTAALQSQFATDAVSIMLTGPDGTGVPVVAEVADEPDEQSRGLQNRTELAIGSGMLFVFADEQPRSFWMKDTLIPLDVLYFNANRELVSMHTMEPCQTDPCTLYPSEDPILYALEVPAGFAGDHMIGEGWRMEMADGEL